MTGNFVVVRNDEDQHSVWPATRELPNGWAVAPGSPTGSQENCLEWIGEHWRTILPRSARPASLTGSSR